MQTDVIFQHFSHQAVDATAHIGQEHEHRRAVVPGRQRALNRIHLSPDPFNPGNQLLLFFSDMGQFPYYILWGYAIKIKAPPSV
jgi:hypothetical protein